MAHPACRPIWTDRRLCGAFLGAIAVVGCSREPKPTRRGVAVVPSRTAIVATPRPSTIVAPRTPVATPSAAAPPRRAFVDPPLPPELVDPPGLLPLPPGPTFDDHHQGGTP